VSGGDRADDTKERIMDQVLALIRAGRLIPATLLEPPEANREATCDIVRAACAAIDMRARVRHNGPHGAVVVVQSGNEWELRAELGPGFRFGNSEYGLVVRRVLR
jgi:hypothetical protein